MKKVLIALGFVCAFLGGMFINEYVFADDINEWNDPNWVENIQEYRENGEIGEREQIEMELSWYRYHHDTLIDALNGECEK